MTPDYDETTMDDRDIRQWTMFIHLGLLAGYVIPLGGFVVPIVLWQLKKDESPIIDAHGKMAVNATLSYLCYAVVAGLLSLILIGIPLLIALLVAAVVCPIIAAVKANEGELWRYPLVISFV